jgi:Lsr2
MAEQIIKRLIDDIDGGEAEETVQFSLDGVPYEIDLSSANAKKVRDSLAPFVEHARKAGSVAGGGRRRRSRAASSRERSADIRAWAKARGIKVNERGRIPATVVEEYERAH